MTYTSQRLTCCVLLIAACIYSVEASPVAHSKDHRAFADALTTRLYEQDNEFSSALGISMAFDLVYSGSVGQSLNQIRDTLRYPAGTNLMRVWNATSVRLNSAYDGSCKQSQGPVCVAKAPTLEIANAVWINNATTLKPGYHSLVGSHVQRTHFDDVGAGGVVNAWVSQKTHGLIDSILQAGKIDASLVAVNAIYLNASWSDQFSETNTNEDVFYTTATRETAVSSDKSHFMHQVANVPYSSSAVEGFQIIKLGYASSKLSMIIALPKSGSTSGTSSDVVLKALPQLQSTRIALALPKFKFEARYSDKLMGALQALGMTAPFLGGFTEIVEGAELYISKIIQKTFIDVHEKGTEAAAVTAIVAEITSAPVSPPPNPILFMADHPFQFFIYDETEDLVLFEGRVGAPTKGSSTAQLKALHSDENFWSSNFRVTPSSSQLPSASSGSGRVRFTLVTFASFLVLACQM